MDGIFFGGSYFGGTFLVYSGTVTLTADAYAVEILFLESAITLTESPSILLLDSSAIEVRS